MKLTEMWKANNFNNYPIVFPRQMAADNTVNTRACLEGRLIELGTKPLTLKTFICDATRIWNNAPSQITKAHSIGVAKGEIKKFVKTLPI